MKSFIRLEHVGPEFARADLSVGGAFDLKNILTGGLLIPV